MNILVLNFGSSSVKFQLIATDLQAIANNSDKRLARGEIERIGGEAIVNLTGGAQPPKRATAPIRDHRTAVDFILKWACSDQSGVDGIKTVADINAVGHRVVHGGERFRQSV